MPKVWLSFLVGWSLIRTSGLHKSTDPGTMLLAYDEINGYGRALLLGECGFCRLELVSEDVQGVPCFLLGTDRGLI